MKTYAIYVKEKDGFFINGYKSSIIQIVDLVLNY